VFKLIKDARLRRLRGTQVADVVTGNIIQYNSLTDVFTVDGSPQKGGERVRATLTPRNETAAPPAPRASAPLRIDNTLGGGRK